MLALLDTQSNGSMAQIAAAKFRANVDPRELAIYTPADAADFLGIKRNTLASWINGRYCPTATRGRVFFEPLIKPADPDNRLLSFFNLAEAHVLAATRYEHNVRLAAVRRATQTLMEKYPSPHPLISHDFFTNGQDLFVRTLEENENLSNPGQLNIKPIMDMFLKHIERDEDDLVSKVYPIIKGLPRDKMIVIVNGVASGQPILSGRGVPVWIVHSRYQSGESKASVARDFGITPIQVQRAVDYCEKRTA
jgi:uncharacterized protein (DUF433 family)